MGDEQRKLNYQKLSKYVRKYTSAWWGESFVKELRRISETSDRKVRFNTPKGENPSEAAETHQESKQDLPIRTKESEDTKESER